MKVALLQDNVSCYTTKTTLAMAWAIWKRAQGIDQIQQILYWQSKANSNARCAGWWNVFTNVKTLD